MPIQKECCCTLEVKEDYPGNANEHNAMEGLIMMVTDTSLQFSSEHTAKEKQSQRESLSVWGPEGNLVFEREGEGTALVKLKDSFLTQNDQVQLSEAAQRGRGQKAGAVAVPDDHKVEADLNIQLLRAMIERLTGKVMDIRFPQDAAAWHAENSESERPLKGDLEGIAAQQSNANGFGLEYDYYESHYEYESTSFSGEGTIKTADGKEIEFSVQLNMSREFMSEQNIHIEAGERLKDPLVINFSGTAAQLSTSTFEFDLDMDGSNDQMRFVQPGSGYLALDRNNDGLINNGSELFGPRSGEGFAELAEYDSDGNIWIDENDDIFDQLRIWTRNEQGENRLFSLGQTGIGAVYLNHIDTPFTIKDNDNTTLGKVRDTGLYVKDDGSAGTIQQIDLTV